MQNELQKVFKVQDEKELSNYASHFEFIIDIMKDQQAKMAKQMDQANKQVLLRTKKVDEVSLAEQN
jgi:hypothetical protein